jgi:hypothetical protein
MCKKKILSLSAAVAVLSTGALAFDTNTKHDVIRLGSAPGKYIKRDNNSIDTDAIGSILDVKEGSSIGIGDVLIFPAFFGGLTEKEKNDPNNKRSNWSSEFTVVNVTEHAVIAKVVLYGKIASEELRDFNIYLSAHDVFRAKLENGRLISTDGSTVSKDDVKKNNPEFDNGGNKLLEVDANNNYKYDYDVVMANEEELNVTIDPDEELDNNGKHIGEGHGIYGKTETDFEHDGYIVVYAMAQADKSYHDKNGGSLHKALWEDYRHLIDTCRNSVVTELDGSGVLTKTLNEWHVGIQDGIYSKNKLYLPNVSSKTSGIENEIIDTEYQSHHICDTVFRSEAYTTKDDKPVEVHFSTPIAPLTGSIRVSQKGDDGRGSRSMILKAYNIANFTDPDSNQMLLWTEGEFAHIADRCLYYQEDPAHGVGPKDGNGSKYDMKCVERDANSLKIYQAIYEYTETDPDLSRLIVTQPYKRILIQSKAETDKDKSNYPTYSAYAWYEESGFDVNDRRKYGEFSLNMDIYNDDENTFTPVLGSFIVSPATAGSSKGIPYEVSNISIFANMSEKDKDKFKEGNGFERGYALIDFNSNGQYVSGILTQMSAKIVPVPGNPHNAEVNWVYPATLKY